MPYYAAHRLPKYAVYKGLMHAEFCGFQGLYNTQVRFLIALNLCYAQLFNSLAWSKSKTFDTLMLFLKDFSKKLIL